MDINLLRRINLLLVSFQFISLSHCTCSDPLHSVTDTSDASSEAKLRPVEDIVVGNTVVRRPYDLSVVSTASQEVLNALRIAASSGDGAAALPTLHKSYTWWLDDPWAAFVALGGLVIVLAFVAIIVLQMSYSK